MNKKFKKFRPFVLLGVISVLAVLFFFDIHYAYAAESGGGVWDLIWNTTKNGIATLAAYILYYLVFMPISGVFWAAGQFFNVCVAISLNSEVFNTKMVVDGWAISRDVANLFFIFILLYIAIATILQLSDYGMKQLLGKIIIIALLVNFSLLITRVIVDSSNILALEFYDSISVEGGTKTSIMAGGTAKDLSQVFVSGFNPQNLLKSKNFQSTVDKSAGDTLLVVVVSMLLASILVLVAAFVLFAAGVLFVIRTVTLWFLMVLAPLAFLAMVLPATRGHASKWWTKLFEQSFFAPVFMFLFYLVAKIIDSGFLNNMVTSIDVGGGVSEGFKETFSTFAVVSIQFVFLGALMIACLVIAKQMGAAGATTMQKWGQGAKKWGQGYAGKISRRGVGYTAEKAIDEQSWINRKTGGRIAKVAGMPLIGRGFAKVSSLRQQEIEKKKKQYEKDYGSYSNVGLETMLRQPLITREKRDAIKRIQEDRIEKDKKKKRKDELRKVADDPNQNTTTRLAAMKMLGDLDVQTELEETKKQLESEKAKSAEKATLKPAKQVASKPKEATEKT